MPVVACYCTHNTATFDMTLQLLQWIFFSIPPSVFPLLLQVAPFPNSNLDHIAGDPPSSTLWRMAECLSREVLSFSSLVDSYHQQNIPKEGAHTLKVDVVVLRRNQQTTGDTCTERLVVPPRHDCLVLCRSRMTVNCRGRRRTWLGKPLPSKFLR